MTAIVIDPQARLAMKSAIVEITNCLEKIDGQKEQIKSIVERAETEFGIKKKAVRRMARTMFDSSYEDLQQENEDFELLYESIVMNKT